ncbi:MAG: hypothetical protein DHS80DRAFT_16661 [Piptocephalis tieghemiana]|nr:MAG: hypothetical protein DHS80DRAFT_16661 [Piptocephalis tieghemiana]
MDFQNRVGSKPGSGGVASGSESNVARRERLRRLALETIDLAKDPYFMKNHVGTYECKLCLTLHPNEGSYLAHTQGKKHQSNLGMRAAKEAKEGRGPQLDVTAAARAATAPQTLIRRNVVRIGMPGYRVQKIRDEASGRVGLLFRLRFPEIDVGVRPLHRFMSAFEQHVETPPDRAYQYLVFAADPYNNVAFKIRSMDINHDEEHFWSHWDPDAKQYTLQFFFTAPLETLAVPPPPPVAVPMQ